MSEQFITKLVEQVSKISGFNYYLIKNEEDFQNNLLMILIIHASLVE